MSPTMIDNHKQSILLLHIGAVAAVVLGLYASSFYSYLLFHGLVEFTAIAISFTLFIFTWNIRRFITNGSLKIIGIGYGLIAVVDLLHTLAYKGMGVFPAYDANLPTQLWIAARSLQATLLLAAPFFSRRDLNERTLFGISLIVVFSTMALVFSGAFPDCFIEGKGLTPFKIISEYVISLFLILALCLFIDKRSAYSSRIFTLIVISILCTIGSELAFTTYLSVYGPTNMLGHFLKLAAFYLIYRALVMTGLQEPFELIFRELRQTKDGLVREREFNRCLLDSMADGVVACDENGVLVLFNRTAREWHGLDPMGLSKEEWARHYDLYRADGTTPLSTEEIPLAMAFNGETVKDAGMAIVVGDQPPRFILANGGLITDVEGHKLGAVVVMRDITVFRRLELELRRTNEALEQRVAQRTAALQANERRLAEAQRMAHVGSWERDLDIGAIFLSDEACRIFGLPVPRKDDRLAPWHKQWVELIHPEDRDRLKLAYDEAISGTKTYDEEYRIIRPDGEERVVHSLAEVERDESGQPHRVLGVMQDITERKRGEGAVWASEERYRRIVDTANEGIWVLGPDGKTSFVNARMAEMLGYMGEEMLGRAFSSFMFTEDLPDHEKKMANRRQGVSEHYERRFRHRSGQTVWTFISAVPVMEASGHFEGSFGMVTDISEKIRAEIELRNLNAGLEQRVLERTAELEKKNEELERMNQLFVGRELKMVELKKRVRELEQ